MKIKVEKDGAKLEVEGENLEDIKKLIEDFLMPRHPAPAPISVPFCYSACINHEYEWTYTGYKCKKCGDLGYHYPWWISYTPVYKGTYLPIVTTTTITLDE